MDLGEYAEALRRELTSITRFAGEDVAKAAELLAGTLDSSVRLALLDVLSAAADEITTRLDGTVVEVRLTGSEPEFVVNVAQGAEDVPPSSAEDFREPAEASDEAGTARVTLRLSENLKSRVETAAGAAGLSVNAWLVRAIGHALDGSGPPGGGVRPPRQPFPPPLFPPPPLPPAAPRRRGAGGQPGRRYTGFARS